jgi:NAD(P)-dependent dehydrogenase (short-subunit alcohol dehydrogenase family)
MTARSMAGRLTRRHAVVVGGAQGIGRATVTRLANEGARVTVADLDRELASVAAEAIRRVGGRATAVKCDIEVPSDVEQLVNAAIADQGEIDILVTCAAIGGTGASHELELEDWQRILRVNLTGTFLCIRQVLPSMLRLGRGSIVTFGSVAAVAAGTGKGAVSYAAAKGAVLALTRAVAVEYATAGVRANCICPGPVATAFGSSSGKMAGTALTNRSPSGVRPLIERRANPAEVAGVVAFLASEDSSYTTGTTLMVDGGQTAI